MADWSPAMWAAFCASCNAYFKGELSEGTERIWQPKITAYTPDEMAFALNRLLHDGQVHMPSLGEILAAVRKDSGRPTFEEMHTILWGRRESPLYMDEPPWGLHATIVSFVNRVGRRRLQHWFEGGEPGSTPYYWRMKELLEAWERHVGASEGREIEALASGGGSEGLRRLDPLADRTALQGPLRLLDQPGGDDDPTSRD